MKVTYSVYSSWTNTGLDLQTKTSAQYNFFSSHQSAVSLPPLLLSLYLCESQVLSATTCASARLQQTKSSWIRAKHCGITAQFNTEALRLSEAASTHVNNRPVLHPSGLTCGVAFLPEATCPSKSAFDSLIKNRSHPYIFYLTLRQRECYPKEYYLK